MADYTEDYRDFGLDEYATPCPFNISTGLITGCPICNKRDNLSRCAACKIVLHQNQKGTDLGVTEADTGDYMFARYDVIDALIMTNTRTAVQVALEHILDMLRLSRCDDMDMRDIAPALFLRLGRDQECYDFIKWWATEVQEPGDDIRDLDSPFLDTRDADVFEAVDPFTGGWPNLSHLLAITLLKIRLLIDLQSLRRTRHEAGPHVPAEILGVIQAHAVISITTRHRSVLERTDHGPQIKVLEEQIKQLYDAVKRANAYVWPAMLRPGNHLTASPMSSSAGAVGDMQNTLRYSYNAWAETPGAIGVIRELGK